MSALHSSQPQPRLACRAACRSRRSQNAGQPEERRTGHDIDPEQELVEGAALPGRRQWDPCEGGTRRVHADNQGEEQDGSQCDPNDMPTAT